MGVRDLCSACRLCGVGKDPQLVSDLRCLRGKTIGVRIASMRGGARGRGDVWWRTVMGGLGR